MNLLNRVLSYDKTKNENQEKCNCAECISVENVNVSKKTEIVGNFKYADDFLIKVENYQMMCREYEILNTINTEYWYKDVKTKNFIWKSLHVHGDKYIYHKSVYVKSKENLIIECRNGHCFPKTPNDHLNGKGCSLCNKKSKGEINIRRFLINNNIEFEREKRFSDCRDKKPLPFDFYLPKYNLCIEYDGIQHFNPSSFAYKQTTEKEKLENLQYIQKHDQMKNDYCKKNGIVLLRFNNLKTVEQELAEYFQNHGIIEQTIFDL